MLRRLLRQKSNKAKELVAEDDREKNESQSNKKNENSPRVITNLILICWKLYFIGFISQERRESTQKFVTLSARASRLKKQANKTGIKQQQQLKNRLRPQDSLIQLESGSSDFDSYRTRVPLKIVSVPAKQPICMTPLVSDEKGNFTHIFFFAGSYPSVLILLLLPIYLT